MNTTDHEHSGVCVTTFDDDGNIALSQEACACKLFDSELIAHMANPPKGYYTTVLDIPQQLQ